MLKIWNTATAQVWDSVSVGTKKACKNINTGMNAAGAGLKTNIMIRMLSLSIRT